MQVFAVLIDVIGIQRYVFSTNKLKENLGASFIIEDIYNSHLKTILQEMYPGNTSIYEEWEKNPDKITICQNNIPFEIGYIGGGNAILFFLNEHDAEKFIKKWTLRLLICCPGIQVSTALDSINLNNFSKERDKLFQKLFENKWKYTCQTIIPRHGITAECPHTGYSMEVWCEKIAEPKYISSVSHAKIMAAEKAKEKLEKILKECGLSNKYIFTDEIDKLGQKEADSHIAVVHIDGNGTGQRFKEKDTLKDIRELSLSLRKAVLNSFKKLLENIDKNFKEIEEEFNISCENDKKVLPLRPIIIGGDDLTFVCDGRLGIYFAKLFLEFLENEQISDGKPLTACAGISITKTKYPFYRAYQLSEELLISAKEKRKEVNDNWSWIDFNISFGNISGSLEEIREKHYTAVEGNLLLRPYKVEDLQSLLKATKELKNSLPRSKIMELREALYHSRDLGLKFIEDITQRGKKLPKFKHFDNSSLFTNKETPYFDMIELMEFYPEFALRTMQSHE